MRVPTLTDLRAEKARRSHVEFMRFVWQRPGSLIVGRHTAAIGEIIDSALKNYANGVSSYWLIKMCHRHGKSDLVSRYLPANFLGKFPDSDVIVAAHTHGLAEDFSRFARGVIRDDKYKCVYPGIEVSRDSAALKGWGIEGHVGRTTWIGLNSGIAGKGGSLVVIDDFFRDRRDAESQTVRDSVWSSITDDVMTRLAPTHIVIILATPWHVDDPFGRIAKKMATDETFPVFNEVTFPAYSDDYPTGVLFPERYSRAWYDTQKAVLGPYGTASLLQCNPTVRTGNMLRTEGIRYYTSREELPAGIQWARGWDLASSQVQRMKDDPDYTVGILLGVRKNIVSGVEIPEIYIDDVDRFRLEAPERDARIKQRAIDDGPIPVGVEAFGAYKDAYTTASRALAGLRVVKKLQLPGDKVTKYQVLEPMFYGNRVWMRTAPWNEDLIRELSTVPGAAHDDQADALVVAYETFSPYNDKVWPGYPEPKTYGYSIEWDADDIVAIVSVWMGRDLKLWVIGAVYSGNKLFVYRCDTVDGGVGKLVARIGKPYRMKTRVDHVLCNDRMIVEETNSPHKLLNRELRNANLFGYAKHAGEQVAGIFQIGEMLDGGRVFIHNDAQEAAVQVSGWHVENSTPVINQGYCEALCQIGSLIKTRYAKASPKPVGGYREYSGNRDGQPFHGQKRP